MRPASLGWDVRGLLDGGRSHRYTTCDLDGAVKALTLTQPWATLVITGRKRFETRSWRTDYRGQLAIHAAKGMPGWAAEVAREFGLDPTTLPRGVVLGTAYLTATSRTEEVREALRWADDHLELAAGDYDDDRWAWQFVMPLALAKPIPARGALGLWEWSPWTNP